jgi:peptidoglycan/xylan/chitin deacetylase (PgdA/CDA1 family)
MPLPEPRLLVLMYHGIQGDAADPGCFDPRYSVTPDAFEQQMQRLAARDGAWLPTAGQPLQMPETTDGRPQVMVTFDDGDVSNALRALPSLRAMKLRAVFFITSDFVGRGGMVSPSQLCELVDGGMLIGSHGATHRFLSSLDEPALRDELQRSRDYLQEHTGRPVDLLALPGGRGGQREVDVAAELGYRAVFGSEPGDNRHWRPGSLVQRVTISRDLSLAGFDQVLAWGGSTVRRMCWRHAVLRVPKRVLGDERFDRLRQALVR